MIMVMYKAIVTRSIPFQGSLVLFAEEPPLAMNERSLSFVLALG